MTGQSFAPHLFGDLGLTPLIKSSFLPSLILLCASKRKIKKSFRYVGNTVSQLWEMLICEPDLIHGKTLYVCDYPPIEVKAWADLIAEKSGRKKTREVSLFILKTLAMIGDTLKVLAQNVVGQAIKN